jgi:electron transport complex protein RnfG
MKKSLALSLLPFIIVCLIGVESVYQASKESIAEQQRFTLQKKLSNVFPTSLNEKIKPILIKINIEDNLPLLPIKKDPKHSNAWLVCNAHNQMGIILTVRTTQGYSGNIDLLVGIDNKQSIVGISVLKHQETPGLGDKIELSRSQWIKQFIGHSKESVWKLTTRQGIQKTNSFDAITAATITSKAVLELLKNTLQTFTIKYAKQQC